MPFEVKEQPGAKNCPECGSPMTYQDLGRPFYIWRCTSCRYKETCVPLVVDYGSLTGMVGQL